MYNWTITWVNDTIPKLSDYLNTTDPASSRVTEMITGPWLTLFGGWFFVLVFGFMAGAVQIKYKNWKVTAVYFILIVGFFGGLISPSIQYIIALAVTFILGFMLYQLFVSKNT